MAYNVFNLYGYGGTVLGDKKENDFLKLLRENQKIGYGINDDYTPPATTQAATPNTQDPMEELRRRLNIPAPEPFVNPITNPHQSQILQKWGEMTTPLAATIADVGGNVGLGMAKGIEGIMDAGATVGAWGARAIGADQAEQRIRDFIVKDHFGDDGSFSDAMVDAGSLLGNGKAGDIIRGISQGVGQMLPSVAAAIITGGGSVAGMTALGLSAGGGGVEEALSEGAGLGRATLYGAASAGTEIFFEKMVGGPMAKVFGGGWLDDVTGSVLKVGAGRVAKNAVGEGVEEGLAELASPLLKSIYKGVDAFSEYGDKDYWKGVGESALIGAGTSVAFGGTVGRAMGTSGKAADVASLADDISSNAKRRMELYREGKIAEGDENDRRTSRTMLADYQKLQEILQKTNATERSRLIKANNLGGVVDENGTVRPSVLASLTIEDADSQTPTGEQNAAQGKKTPLSGAYLSPGLWRQGDRVQSDLKGISDDLKANGKEGKPVELFRGELSEAAQENYNAFKRAASKLSLQSDNKLQFALIDAPSGVSGVHRGGTVYLNTETLEDGKWARVLFEEATHFTDGTAEAADFKAFLEKEDGLFEDVAEGLLAQGNAYGFTDENVMGEKSETFNREMYAQMASRVLTSPEYVDKLVRADRTLAEKIKNRISDVAETLRSVTSKDIEVRKQLRQATKAQGLFERALESSGKIVGGGGEQEERDYKLNGDFEDEGIDKYTEKQYNDFGWARADGVLSTGKMRDFTEKFAAAKTNQGRFPTTKSGEYMIAVSDIYGESDGVNNVIVYASGDMDSPKISRVLEIDLDNETEIDVERRNLYDAERRGLQPEAGGVFRFHYPTDNGYRSYEQRVGEKKNSNSSEFRVQRGRGREASDRIKGFKVNDDGTYTYTYADGRTEIVTGKKQSRGGEKSDFSFTSEDRSADSSADSSADVANQQASEDEKEISKEKRELKEYQEETTRRENILGRIIASVQTLKDMAENRKCRFFAPSTYQSKALKKIFSELGNIKVDNVNSGSVRESVKRLASWYNDKENSLFPEMFERKPWVQEVMAWLSEGENELTTDELNALQNVMTYFSHVAQETQKTWKDGKRVDAQPLAEQMIEHAEKSVTEQAPLLSVAKHTNSKGGNYFFTWMRPETVARMADNMGDGFHTWVFKEAQRAEVARDKMRIKMRRKVDDYLAGNKKYLGRVTKQEITFRDQSMTVGEMLQLYLTLKREQAQVHLAYGGFEVIRDGKRVKLNNLDVDGLIPEDITMIKADELKEISAEICAKAKAELEQIMTEQDKEFAKLLHDAYNTECVEAKIEGDMRAQGFSNVTPGDKDYTPMMIAQKATTADLGYRYLEKVDRYSFNKQIYELAVTALLIMPAQDVFNRHTNDLATYVEIKPVIDSFNVMYNLDVNDSRRNPKTIKATLERQGGFSAGAAKYMRELLTDLQGKEMTRASTKWIENIVKTLRSTYALSALALNFNSWMSQMSSYIAAGSVVNAKAIWTGGFNYAKGVKRAQLEADIDKYSDVAMVRNHEGYAVKAQTLIEKTSAFANKMMTVTAKLDRFVVRRLWGVCLVQVTGRVEAARKASNEQKAAAGELLNRVILQTQQNSMVTTKSGAMRSDNDMYRFPTMFTADSMMNAGQVFDGVFTVATLEKQRKEELKNATTEQEKAQIKKKYEADIKEARKNLGSAAGALAASAVYTAAVSMALRALRGALDEEEEEKWGRVFLSAVVGNALGGLPIISWVYDAFSEGYEVENFAISALNDAMKAVYDMYNMLSDMAQGKEVSKQEAARKIRALLYAIGTMTGIPFRNVNNIVRTVLGAIGLLDEGAAYKYDNFFYEQSYGKDLEKALLDGDDQMVDTIVGIMLDQDGGEMNEGTRRATAKLIKSGYEGILPRSIPETLTNAQDVEIELTKKQRQQFEKVYSAAYRAADDLVRMGYFKAASKDEQAYALKFIWSTYYALAKDTVLGEDSTKKNVLFAEAISVERLALIVAQASAIKADVDKNGKAINGSRMHKIEALIESLHLSAAQKYMMMGYLGYTNKKGRELVERYIRTLGLSQAEQAELLEMSGYREK